MAYLVKITQRAERDVAILYEAIHAEHSATALKWYLGLKKAILSLEKLPYRGQVTQEDSRLRRLLYGRKPDVYRIIYRVREKQKQVQILHIRHGARRASAATDLD